MPVKLFQSCNLWTVACQAPLSMGFSRQEHWSGFPSSFSPPPHLLFLPGLSFSLFIEVGSWDHFEPFHARDTLNRQRWADTSFLSAPRLEAVEDAVGPGKDLEMRWGLQLGDPARSAESEGAGGLRAPTPACHSSTGLVEHAFSEKTGGYPPLKKHHPPRHPPWCVLPSDEFESSQHVLGGPFMMQGSQHWPGAWGPGPQVFPGLDPKSGVPSMGFKRHILKGRPLNLWYLLLLLGCFLRVWVLTRLLPFPFYTFQCFFFIFLVLEEPSCYLQVNLKKSCSTCV